MKSTLLSLLFTTGITQMAQAQGVIPRMDKDVEKFCTAFPGGRFESVLLAGFADTSAALFGFVSEEAGVQVIFADNGDGVLTMDEAVSFSAVLKPQNDDGIDYFQLVTLNRETAVQRYRHAGDARAMLRKEPHSAEPVKMWESFHSLRKIGTP